MSDQFTEQLSAYLDGELGAIERERLEAHLGGCAACQAVLADLRAIVAAAPEYPGRAPARDLWPGIEARLERDGKTQRRNDAKWSDGAPTFRRSVLPSFRLSLPQLLAASIVMAALGGGSVWLALRGNATPSRPPISVVQAPSTPPPAVQPPDTAARRPPVESPLRPSNVASSRLSVLSADQSYDRAVRDLERVLETGRGRLDSTTVVTIESSLRKIDAAIAEARAAIQRDPANAYLSRQIASNMQRKLELLRIAANAINTRT